MEEQRQSAAFYAMSIDAGRGRGTKKMGFTTLVLLWRCYNADMRQIVIYPDPEDGGYVVEVPSLPGCASQGETKAEAINNIRDAIEAWIEGAKHLGADVPEDKLDVQVCVVP